MSQTIKYYKIGIDNQNIIYNNEILEYRKSQLTIEKKKKSFNINNFILDKLLSKLNQKYKLLIKKDNYVFFIENKNISKKLYDFLNKYIIFDISKNIEYQKKVKINKITILVFQLDLKKNIIIDFSDSKINTYLNINIKKEKTLVMKKKVSKKSKEDHYENDDDEEDDTDNDNDVNDENDVNDVNDDIIDEDDDDDDEESDYNSDFNDIEYEEDELKDIDYENDLILDELEELDKEPHSDIEEDTTTISNNTMIYLKDNIIIKEFNINNDYTELYNTRKKTIDIFKKIIKKIDIVLKIEISILNYSIDKCKSLNIIPTWDNPNVTYIYINKARHLYQNLNTKSYISNDYLIKKIEKEGFDIFNIAYLKREEIMPSKWIPLIEENNRKEEIINQSHSAASTEQYVCPNRNCRARKAVYKEVQTRSADEPMTLFLTCLVCGKKWKY